MPTHDDMLDLRNHVNADCLQSTAGKTNLEVNDRMFHRSLAGQIAINNHIAQIPMLQHLVWQKVQNRRLLAVTVRASNPQNLLLRALWARYEIRADRSRRISQASLGLLCLLHRRLTVPGIIKHSNRHLESLWAQTNEAPTCVEIENLTGKHLEWASAGSTLAVYTAGVGQTRRQNCSIWARWAALFSVRRMPGHEFHRWELRISQVMDSWHNH